MLFGALIRTVYDDWHPSFGNTSWLMPFWPHWHIVGIFILGVGSMLLGAVADDSAIQGGAGPAFFAAMCWTASTPTSCPKTHVICFTAG